MIEFAAFIVFLLMLAVSLYQVVSLRVRLSKATSLAIQAKADSIALSAKLGEALAEKSLSENADFIKFLNTSRDWAFSYIEEVQEKINNLKSAMDSGDDTKISIAYNEIISMIPENGEQK